MKNLVLHKIRATCSSFLQKVLYLSVFRGKRANFCKEESFHEPTMVEVIRIEDVDISYHRSVDIQDKERVNSITYALSRLGGPVFVQNCFCIVNWERPVGSLV